MKADVLDFLQEKKACVEQALSDYMQDSTAPKSLVEAMNYSLMAGGKRIRPIFLFAAMQALDGDQRLGIPAACALEMIHTYSLIHDDLPAMDNDDYRRGKLTNHKVFGEGLAILAGDGLLTHAFYLLAAEQSHSLPAFVRLKMVEELAHYAGMRGMVGGQVADIEGEERSLTMEELVYIHQHKTADLLICSVRLGCYAAGANSEQLQALSAYAEHIGMAFQIKDDILDEIGEAEKLGKAVGSDKQNGKTTYVSLLGLERAQEEVERHILAAKEALLQADLKRDLLIDLAELMVEREN